MQSAQCSSNPTRREMSLQNDSIMSSSTAQTRKPLAQRIPQSQPLHTLSPLYENDFPHSSSDFPPILYAKNPINKLRQRAKFPTPATSSPDSDPIFANDSTPKDQSVKQLKAESDNKKDRSDSTIQIVLKMWQELLEKQKTIKISISRIDEKLRLLDEHNKKSTQDLRKKLDSIQSEINPTMKPEVPSKIKESDVSADITESVYSIQDKTNSETMSTSGKYFVLKHKFENVSSFKNNKFYFGEEEEHFGVPWQICVERNNGFLSFYLWNLLSNKTEKNWEMDLEYELKIVSPGSKEKKIKFCRIFKDDENEWGLFEFIEWDELEKDFVVDDCFCAEIAVKMRKMTGVYKENLRNFNETMEEFSDVVLLVNEEKFYVLKLYLASHSPYFKTLFMGNFKESKKFEIKLTGIDADDFQKYLEVLYGEQAIDDITIEGILIVSDMFDTPLIIRRCENFLLKESKKRLKKKLEMSIRYNLDALKKQCISEIKSIDDIKSVIPGDIHDMDSSIMAELFQKFLKLH
ncbi:hypothetical protein GCK72_007497 [Caenorhabditis remanei]|uniref:BTB domain-containing protein n=1 Tax=Caenorhabditis remanei TaxID=31234 RepID=A0A6A5HI43_CAERE|nr:hypothetical protein GCK72_007497 [Caenorhabditis remanei]KAF1767538.1 hypothetical protein GCK72_007497 [Caenorhabditis remanei]